MFHTASGDDVQLTVNYPRKDEIRPGAGSVIFEVDGDQDKVRSAGDY